MPDSIATAAKDIGLHMRRHPERRDCAEITSAEVVSTGRQEKIDGLSDAFLLTRTWPYPGKRFLSLMTGKVLLLPYRHGQYELRERGQVRLGLGLG